MTTSYSDPSHPYPVVNCTPRNPRDYNNYIVPSFPRQHYFKGCFWILVAVIMQTYRPLMWCFVLGVAFSDWVWSLQLAFHSCRCTRTKIL